MQTPVTNFAYRRNFRLRGWANIFGARHSLRDDKTGKDLLEPCFNEPQQVKSTYNVRKSFPTSLYCCLTGRVTDARFIPLD